MHTAHRTVLFRAVTEEIGEEEFFSCTWWMEEGREEEPFRAVMEEVFSCCSWCFRLSFPPPAPLHAHPSGAGKEAEEAGEGISTATFGCLINTSVTLCGWCCALTLSGVRLILSASLRCLWF
jgi:hypothetical protein